MKLMLLFSLLSTSAFATEWTLDKTHSSLNFSIDHLVISETTGNFRDYQMSVQADKEDFTDAKFTVDINTVSIDTADAKRDEHLRSADFFDVKKNPSIKFIGKNFTKVKGQTYKVYGTLTMNGITKDVILDGKFGGIVKDPWGGTRAGLKITGAINRKDYGLKYNSILENGGFAIGEEVRINANVELIKKS
jgi:polyisoprenoid-binding protein YceI